MKYIIRISALIFLISLAMQVFAKEAEFAWSPIILLSNDEITSIYETHNGELLAGTQSRGIVRSTDGYVWTSLSDEASAVTSALNIKEDNSGNLYVSGSENGLLKSVNSGSNWVKISGDEDFVKDFYIDGNSVIYYTTTTGDVYKSYDGGVKWDKVNLPGNGNASLLRVFYSNLIFASQSDILFKSIDGGTSWIEVLKLDGGAIFDITMDNNSRMYVSAGLQGLFVSKDEGDSWINMNINPYNIDVRGIRSFKNQTTIMLFNDSKGIYKSIDGGYNWVEFNDNQNLPWLDNSFVNDMICTNDGSLIAIANNKLITRPLDIRPPNGVKNDTSSSDIKISMSPNPGTANVIITMKNNKANYITLSLFNTEGCCVSSISEGTYQPGEYKFTLDCKEYASGNYFVVLQTDSDVLMKSLVINL